MIQQKYKLIPLFLLVLIFIPLSNATTIPAGITNYIPITLNNTQTTATPNPYQAMVNVSLYIGLQYNNNTANFEYFYANGTIIPAWIESNQSSILTTWVKVGSIPASSSITIYLGYNTSNPNLLSNTGTTGIGEAPQLSTTYGQYDNGASVFSYYQRWGGLSALPTNYASISGGTATFSPNYTTFSASSSSYWGGVIANVSLINIPTTFPMIIDTYGNFYSSASNGGDFMGFINSSNFGAGGGQQYTYGVWYNHYYNIWQNTTGSVVAPNINQIYSLDITSSTTATGSANYHQVISVGASTLTSQIPLFFGYGIYDLSPTPIVVYYTRTRAYPPNGVAPQVSEGAVLTPKVVSITATPTTVIYGQTILLNATCSLSGDVCNIESPLATILATGTGSASYTLSAGSLAVGNYVYYVNDTTDNIINSTNVIITIATPTLTTISITPNTNFVYNGNPITTTYGISSYNNQLQGTFWIDNTNTSVSKTSSNTYTQIGIPNTYIHTFKTIQVLLPH